MKRYFGKTKKKQNNKMVKKTQYNRKLKNTGLINGGKYEKKIKIYKSRLLGFINSVLTNKLKDRDTIKKELNNVYYTVINNDTKNMKEHFLDVNEQLASALLQLHDILNDDNMKEETFTIEQKNKTNIP
jgi:hypothetical protein